MESRLALLVLLFFATVQFCSLAAGLTCNGSPSYCDLRFNQFTFAATHNSYARDDSTSFKLYGKKIVPNTDCFARNQAHSITQQLENGVRSLEIDTCARDYFDFWKEKFLTEAYSCRKVLYVDPVSKIFTEIDAWLKEHWNEVVVLSFTGKVEKWSSEAIAKNIKNQLEEKWAPTLERRLRKDLSLNDRFAVSGQWPTLRDAIMRNQRIFLFVHPKLTSHMGAVSWTHDFTWVKQTRTKMRFQASNNCQNLIPMIDEECKTDDRFVSVDMFLTRGLPVCTSVRAESCNPLLAQAAEFCCQRRKERNLTVNFLKIDFPEKHDNLGYKILKKVAKKINCKNLETYRST